MTFPNFAVNLSFYYREFLFVSQFVFFLVMCVLWLIVTVIQIVVALVAWLIWYRILKVVESECEQISDACVCLGDKNVPFTGKKKNPTLPYHFGIPTRCFVESVAFFKLVSGGNFVNPWVEMCR